MEVRGSREGRKLGGVFYLQYKFLVMAPGVEVGGLLL